MRVAIVSPNFAEYSIRWAAGMRTADPSAAVRVFVDAQALARDATPRLMRLGEGLVDTFSPAADGRVRKVIAILRAALRVARFRPDVIQVHEHPDAPTTLLYRLLARVAPIVSLVHDPQPHSGRDAAYAARQQRYTRRQRDLARAFLVHGDHCRALAAERIRLGDRPLLAIRHGGILEPANLAADAGQPGRVLMFGRMEAYKGLEVLLDAMRLLRQRHVPALLHLAGRGSEITRLRGEFEALGGVEIDDHYLRPDELTAAIGRAALIVAPYLDATQSGVVAAALQNGRPVVASAIGGLREAVRDGIDGMLVPAGDSQALAAALQALIASPERLADLSYGARTGGRAAIAWAPIGTRCLTLYREILS